MWSDGAEGGKDWRDELGQRQSKLGVKGGSRAETKARLLGMGED